MFKKMIVIAAAAVATSAIAETPSLRSFCFKLGALAESTMEMRQVGVPLSEALGIPEKMEDDDPKISKLIEKITLEAYEYPQVWDELVSRKFINDFASDWLRECLQSLDE